MKNFFHPPRLGWLNITGSYQIELYFKRWKLPSIVMWWLIATAMTGMNIIMLPTTLAETSHAGIGPPMRWWMPAHE